MRFSQTVVRELVALCLYIPRTAPEKRTVGDFSVGQIFESSLQEDHMTRAVLLCVVSCCLTHLNSGNITACAKRADTQNTNTEQLALLCSITTVAT